VFSIFHPLANCRLFVVWRSRVTAHAAVHITLARSPRIGAAVSSHATPCDVMRPNVLCYAQQLLVTGRCMHSRPDPGGGEMGRQ
jgi:hypothetical protein